MPIDIKNMPGELIFTYPGDSLHGADLSHMDLTGANLSGLNMSEAKLVGANLSGAFMVDTLLKNADLKMPI